MWLAMDWMTGSVPVCHHTQPSTLTYQVFYLDTIGLTQVPSWSLS